MVRLLEQREPEPKLHAAHDGHRDDVVDDHDQPRDAQNQHDAADEEASEDERKMAIVMGIAMQDYDE